VQETQPRTAEGCDPNSPNPRAGRDYEMSQRTTEVIVADLDDRWADKKAVDRALAEHFLADDEGTR
jgi:hypothetical protein